MYQVPFHSFSGRFSVLHTKSGVRALRPRSRLMSRKLAIALTVFGIAALLPLLTGFSSNKQAFTGTVYLGMDTPLTGPQAVVGQGDRETVQALVAFWNRRGGIKGRRIVVDVLDNASNPSQ